EPRSDVAPAGIERHDGGRLRLLHDGVVDGIRRRRQKRPPETREVAVHDGLVRRPLARGRNVRRMTAELLEIATCGKEEHPAVPQVLARFYITLGPLEIGF